MTPPTTWITLTREELEQLEQYTRAAAQEDWQQGHSATETTDDATLWIDTVIKKRADPDLHLVFIGNPDIENDSQLIAVTGNGPRSMANAQYLIMAQPGNMLKLLAFLWRMIGTAKEIAIPIEGKEEPPVCTP